MIKNKLLAKMVEHGDTQADLAKALSMSAPNLNRRIHGHVDFRLSEIDLIKKRYNLSAEDIDNIFLADAVSD